MVKGRAQHTSNAVMIASMHVTHLKTLTALHNSCERAVVRRLQRQGRLVHAKITPGKVGGQVAAQALQVELDTTHRAEVYHVAAAHKGSVSDASATGAARDCKVVVGIRGHRDAVADEADNGFEDGGVLSAGVSSIQSQYGCAPA